MFDQNQKIMYFVQAIMDMYQEPEDRDSYNLMPIPLNENGEFTEDMYCMFIALKMIYQKISGEKCDNLDFITVLNRLVFQFSKHIPYDMEEDEEIITTEE